MVSDTKLLTYAEDACQKSEAYFYQAMTAYTEQKLDVANQHLEQVLAQKSYHFVEYNMAKLLLKNPPAI